MDYLNKFGKVVTSKVIYATFREGPLKGLKNGDRSYKIEVQPNVNIGTYHVLDGHKVTIRYPGQQQTCARCFETAKNCKGGGMARRCEAAGSDRVELSQYILGLWQSIGYTPGELEVAGLYDDHGDDAVLVNQQTGGSFTPAKSFSDPSKYKGVTIKTFPKETDPGDIMEFLVTSGLPDTYKDSVQIQPNGTVIINDLENTVCRILIDSIHNTKYMDRRLFCNGVIPLTPEKPTAPVCPPAAPPATTSGPLAAPSVYPPRSPQHVVASSSGPPAAPPATTSGPLAAPSVSSPRSSQHLSLFTSASTSTPSLTTRTVTSPSMPSHSRSSTLPLEKFGQTLPSDFDVSLQMSNDEFLRRHSLSLRTPPLGSVADEILASAPLSRTKSLLDDLKGISEKLSDFGSCISSSEDDWSECESRKSRKLKRARASPQDKNFFLKKQNTASSPLKLITNNDRY